jgi:hypothetical protein
VIDSILSMIPLMALRAMTNTAYDWERDPVRPREARLAELPPASGVALYADGLRAV